MARRQLHERIEPRFTNTSPENPSTNLANPDAWLLDWGSGGASYTGPPVSEQTSMQISAVFACVSLISSLIAGLPLKIYRDTPDGGREEMPDHRLAGLLGEVPYPGRPLTSFAWRELWGWNLNLWGNHYSIIQYDGAARVTGFVPVMPWNVQVIRQNGLNWYRCTLEDRSVVTVAHDDMLHLPGPGFDGIKGVSRVQMFARDSLGLARTLEQQVGLMHENAAKPSGMVTIGKSRPDPDGLRRMKAQFAGENQGRANAGKVVWMDEGATYTPFQLTAEDLNTLASRQYQAADVCRFFGVPPHLVGLEGASAWGTGIQQLTLGFLMFKMSGELQRIESELNAKLLVGTPYYAWFDRQALLEMDIAGLTVALTQQVGAGLLTPNEGRRLLKRGAQPDGDGLLVNSTLMPLSRAVNPPPPPPVIGPPPDAK